jgi:hypothetical protein
MRIWADQMRRRRPLADTLSYREVSLACRSFQIEQESALRLVAVRQIGNMDE